MDNYQQNRFFVNGKIFGISGIVLTLLFAKSCFNADTVDNTSSSSITRSNANQNPSAISEPSKNNNSPVNNTDKPTTHLEENHPESSTQIQQNLRTVIATKASTADKLIAGKLLKNEFGWRQPERTADQWIHTNPKKGLISFLVFNENHKVVGTFAYQRWPDEKRPLFVVNVVVEPELRGKGIGKAINTLILKEAKRFKYKHIYLNALEAVGFWRKLGWKIIDTQPHNTDIAAVMEHEVPGFE